MASAHSATARLCGSAGARSAAVRCHSAGNTGAGPPKAASGCTCQSSAAVSSRLACAAQVTSGCPRITSTPSTTPVSAVSTSGQPSYRAACGSGDVRPRAGVGDSSRSTSKAE